MEQSNIIKILEEHELDQFRMFLETHWKKNHVFIRDSKILDFQHKDVDGNYTFLISKRSDNEIDSILGYVFTNEKKDSIWLAIWKSINNSGEGFRLLKKLNSSINPKFIGAIGISEDAQKLYKILGWKLGSTKHYFLNLSYPVLRRNELNKSQSQYEIVKRIFNVENNPNSFPIKDEFYYEKRFLNHPSYDYVLVYLESLKLLFIGRVINYLGFNIFRIVDVIGDMNGIKFRDSLLQFMLDNKIDLIEMNMFDNKYPKIDMLVKKEGEVIPLYIDPFVNDNIELRLGYKCQNNHVRFFLGDSDQDRPN